MRRLVGRRGTFVTCDMCRQSHLPPVTSAPVTSASVTNHPHQPKKKDKERKKAERKGREGGTGREIQRETPQEGDTPHNNYTTSHLRKQEESKGREWDAIQECLCGMQFKCASYSQFKCACYSHSASYSHSAAVGCNASEAHAQSKGAAYPRPTDPPRPWKRLIFISYLAERRTSASWALWRPQTEAKRPASLAESE